MATVKEQLEAARARLLALTASVTPEETQETRDLKELADATAAADEIEKQRRDNDLAKRLTAAKERLPGVELRSLTVKEFSDTFIVRRNGAAHKAWMSSITDKAQKGAKVDSGELAGAYAIASVVDWNGQVIDGSSTSRAYDLRKYLEANPGLTGPITDAAIALNGAVTEERKS